MISETAAGWGVIILAILGSAYFIVLTILAKFQNKEKLQRDPFAQGQGYGNSPYGDYNEEDRQALQQAGAFFDQQQIHQTTINDIHQVADTFFIRQSTFMLAFALGCWLVFYLSFSAKYSIFWSLVSLIFGLLSIAIVAFVTLKLSINASVRYLGESFVSRGHGYSFGWGAGTALAAGVVSITLFLYNFLVPTALFFSIEGDADPTQEQLLAFYFCMMGFVWGVLSGAAFYRQVGAELGRGLNTGADMIGTYNTANILQIDSSKNGGLLAQGRVFGNVLGQTLTHVVDYICILCVLILAFSLIIVESSEINMATFYFPSYAILFCVLFQIIIAAIALGKREVDDRYDEVTPATFNAKNNLLQVILTNVLSAIILIIIPLWLFPVEQFSVGSNAYKPFFTEKLTAYNIVWCTETGLATQCLLVFLGEFYTSNAFKFTRAVANEQMKGAGSGYSQVSQTQAIAQALILVVLGVSVMICHLFAGFLGIACGLVGILSTPILLLGISYVAGFAHDGNVLSKLQGIEENLTRNIRSFYKGASNYQVYLQLTNTTAVFYLNIILIGLMSLYSKVTEVEIWDAFTLFGIFIGGATAYILKASSNQQSTAISQEIRAKYERGYYRSVSLNNYLAELYYGTPVVRVIVNLVGSFFLILIMAWLFGSKTVFGYIIGLNLIGVHIAIYQVLLYNCSKNARNYNQEKFQYFHDQKNHVGMQHSIECDIATSNTESNGLLMYLIFNTLFVMMGGLQYWNTWGAFGKYLSEERTGISESSVGIWDWLGIGNGSDDEAEAEAATDGEQKFMF